MDKKKFTFIESSRGIETILKQTACHLRSGISGLVSFNSSNNFQVILLYLHTFTSLSMSQKSIYLVSHISQEKLSHLTWLEGVTIQIAILKHFFTLPFNPFISFT